MWHSAHLIVISSKWNLNRIKQLITQECVNIQLEHYIFQWLVHKCTRNVKCEDSIEIYKVLFFPLIASRLYERTERVCLLFHILVKRTIYSRLAYWDIGTIWAEQIRLWYSLRGTYIALKKNWGDVSEWQLCGRNLNVSYVTTRNSETCIKMLIFNNW